MGCVKFWPNLFVVMLPGFVLVIRIITTINGVDRPTCKAGGAQPEENSFKGNLPTKPGKEASSCGMFHYVYKEYFVCFCIYCMFFFMNIHSYAMLYVYTKRDFSSKHVDVVWATCGSRTILGDVETVLGSVGHICFRLRERRGILTAMSSHCWDLLGNIFLVNPMQCQALSVSSNAYETSYPRL